MDRALRLLGWFFDDLDSRRATAAAKQAPLSSSQQATVAVIHGAFAAIELAMAVLTVCLAPAMCALFVITFGAGVLPILVGLGTAPTCWLLLRKPRAVLKSLMLDKLAARAWRTSRLRSLATSSSVAIPLPIDR